MMNEEGNNKDNPMNNANSTDNNQNHTEPTGSETTENKVDHSAKSTDISSTDQNNNVLQPEVVNVDEKVNNEKPRKRFNFFPIKLIFFLFLFLFLIFATVRAINIFNTYSNAAEYEKAYDKVQDEFRYCKSIAGTEQTREVFNYCDRFEEEFKNVKEENIEDKN